ncbi:hypothetical protein [Grimontia hollisae]|uniref:Uncharacterized protein n=1 Tax=Grimontia hollisae CIP 101886 TaxID=675812 RepID=D0I799_GRIHO|nr:hypothetical protein [Grimontia hollisae]EEY72518.1 hypothetical protein VHA_001621 [Grimontia hollisae CIP 101886]MDF2185656.1 hypothetical protein [Grimontia hollisae]STO45976.1 Uncharacterised protein [Grimontia hollisae]STQ76628.1 Uncharacterised protein [Grimontia hollisae]
MRIFLELGWFFRMCCQIHSAPTSALAVMFPMMLSGRHWRVCWWRGRAHLEDLEQIACGETEIHEGIA